MAPLPAPPPRRGSLRAATVTHASSVAGPVPAINLVPRYDTDSPSTGRVSPLVPVLGQAPVPVPTSALSARPPGSRRVSLTSSSVHFPTRIGQPEPPKPARLPGSRGLSRTHSMHSTRPDIDVFENLANASATSTGIATGAASPFDTAGSLPAARRNKDVEMSHAGEVEVEEITGYEVVNNFTFLECIGKGGCAEVWKVCDDDGDFFAMKVLRKRRTLPCGSGGPTPAETPTEAELAPAVGALPLRDKLSDTPPSKDHHQGPAEAPDTLAKRARERRSSSDISNTVSSDAKTAEDGVKDSDSFAKEESPGNKSGDSREAKTEDGDPLAEPRKNVDSDTPPKTRDSPFGVVKTTDSPGVLRADSFGGKKSSDTPPGAKKADTPPRPTSDESKESPSKKSGDSPLSGPLSASAFPGSASPRLPRHSSGRGADLVPTPPKDSRGPAAEDIGSPRPAMLTSLMVPRTHSGVSLMSGGMSISAHNVSALNISSASFHALMRGGGSPLPHAVTAPAAAATGGAAGAASEGKHTPQGSRLEREVAVMKKLQHKHIVPLYEVIDDSARGRLLLRMKLVTKGPLLDYDRQTGMTSSKPVSEALVRKYLRQTASGLQYLHDRGIIHRDIKPQNILLDHNDDVYLADFGLSEHSLKGSYRTFPHEGTPAFQSPELVKATGSDAVDGRACDMWALGVTMFSLIAGYHPFATGNCDVAETRRRILDDDIFFPPNVTVSAECKDCIMAMMARDPAARISVSALRKHAFLGRRTKTRTERLIAESHLGGDAAGDAPGGDDAGAMLDRRGTSSPAMTRPTVLGMPDGRGDLLADDVCFEELKSPTAGEMLSALTAISELAVTAPPLAAAPPA